MARRYDHRIFDETVHRPVGRAAGAGRLHGAAGSVVQAFTPVAPRDMRASRRSSIGRPTTDVWCLLEVVNWENGVAIAIRMAHRSLRMVLSTPARHIKVRRSAGDRGLSSKLSSPEGRGLRRWITTQQLPKVKRCFYIDIAKALDPTVDRDDAVIVQQIRGDDTTVPVLSKGKPRCSKYCSTMPDNARPRPDVVNPTVPTESPIADDHGARALNYRAR
jgi:hypothetical protein